MKLLKRVLTGILTMSLMLTAASASMLLTTQDGTQSEELPLYGSFKGKVAEISPYYGVDGQPVSGKSFVLAEDDDGNIVNFVVNDETCFVTDAELAVGCDIIGYYDARLPVIMIYPPQYVAEVMVVSLHESLSVKVDRFDDDLLSYDGSLKLNLSDDTEIVQENGEPFDGELSGRALAVVYGVSTRSWPAQTTPDKIFVLYEKVEAAPGAALPDVVFEGVLGLNVEGEPLEQPLPYLKDMVVMVPLRAVCEALGLEVSWNANERSVAVEDTASLKIGVNSYVKADGQVVELAAAPEITEGSTFVPLSFFKQVLNMNNAYFFEGMVEINNGEIME